MNLDYAEKDFTKLKSKASTCLEKREYEDVFRIVSCAANLAYHLNFKYADDDLETVLASLAAKVLQTPNFIPQENKYVFYDCFGIDNRGLTQQYIRAFKELGVSLLYIKEGNELLEGSDIHVELMSNELASIYQIPSNLTTVEKANEVFSVIEAFKPGKAFLHLAPWSSMAVCLWSNFNKVERYLIDLTDHAFWLGKSCSDYFIGFRDYGISVSINYRGIAPNKLLKNLYYPITTQTKFDGFPFDIKGKVVLFSGGTYYKIYADNYFFLKILQRISLENPDVVIVYVGNGDSKPFIKFIKENKLDERIYSLPERKDITQLFKNSDIYLNTYPIIGGLMSQYAIQNNIPLIGYTSEDIPCNYSESLCLMKKIVLTYSDLDEFHGEVNKLITSDSYRKKYVSNYKNLLPTPESFRDKLKELIVKHEICPFVNCFGEKENERFKSIYLDMENNYLHKYDLLKFRWLGFRYFRVDFYGAVQSVIRLTLNIHMLVSLENLTRIKKLIFKIR